MTERASLRHVVVVAVATAGFAGAAVALTTGWAAADSGLGLPSLSPSPALTTSTPDTSNVTGDLTAIVPGTTTSTSPTPTASPSPSPTATTASPKPSPTPTATPTSTQAGTVDGSGTGGDTGSSATSGGPVEGASSVALPGAPIVRTRLGAVRAAAALPVTSPLLGPDAHGLGAPGLAALPALPSLPTVGSLLDPLTSYGNPVTGGLPPLLAPVFPGSAPATGTAPSTSSGPAATVLRPTAAGTPQSQDLLPSLVVTGLIAFGLGLGIRWLLLSRRARHTG